MFPGMGVNLEAESDIIMVKKASRSFLTDLNMSSAGFCLFIQILELSGAFLAMHYCMLARLFTPFQVLSILCVMLKVVG